VNDSQKNRLVKTVISSLLMPFFAAGGGVRADVLDHDNNLTETPESKMIKKENNKNDLTSIAKDTAEDLLEGVLPDEGLKDCIVVENENGEEIILSCPITPPRSER
jgi:hypothetical protein